MGPRIPNNPSGLLGRDGVSVSGSRVYVSANAVSIPPGYGQSPQSRGGVSVVACAITRGMLARAGIRT